MSAALRNHPLFQAAEHLATTYFHFTFKRAFSKKLTQAQNAETSIEDQIKNPNANARIFVTTRLKVSLTARLTCGPPSACERIHPYSQVLPGRRREIGDELFGL